MCEIDTITRKITAFHKLHNTLFIYGAGKYAKYAFQVCDELDVGVKGFITTKHEKDMYCGLPVLSAEQVKESEYGDIGVIPGFLRCSADDCEEMLGRKNKIHFLECDPNYFMLMIERELIRQIKQRYSSKRMSDNANEHQERILVVRLDAIGDLICTTPLFRAIKEKYSKSELTVIIQKGNKAVLENNPFIDRIYEFDGNIYNNEKDIDKIDEVIGAANKFVAENSLNSCYQKVFMPMQFLEGRNAILTIALAKAVKSRRIISWVKSYEWINNYRKEIAKELPCKVIMIQNPLHEKDYVLAMAREVGIVSSSNRLELYSKKEEAYIDSIIKKDDKKQVVVAVGVVGSLGKKTWNSEYYKELFACLTNKNIKFVLFGASDAVSASEIIGKSSNVINLVNKTTLEQTIYAIKKCDMYLGSNTGLLHMAAAFNKPCITLYSVSKEASPWNNNGPTRWGAQGSRNIDLMPEYCIDGCKESCSKPYSHCINQITVNEVRDAIYSLITENDHETNYTV